MTSVLDAVQSRARADVFPLGGRLNVRRLPAARLGVGWLLAGVERGGRLAEQQFLALHNCYNSDGSRCAAKQVGAQ